MEFLFLIFGIAGLIIGSNLVIKGAKNLAHYLRVSELFIGLTFVAIGTSLPEIAVNVASGVNKLYGADTSGIAVGNIIGSSLNLFTIILGSIAIFSNIYISKRFFKRDAVFLLASVFVFFIMAVDLKITRFEGIVLVVFYIYYIYSLRHSEEIVSKEKERRKKVNLFLDVLLLIGGIALVIYSSNTVVSFGIIAAKTLNIPETLIGIIIVSLGTSLPELSISFLGIIKKTHFLSLGNLMGSVVCNVLLALGLGSAISGFVVNKNLVFFDIPFLFFALLVALLFLRRKERLFKWEASILVCIYFIYLGIKIVFGV